MEAIDNEECVFIYYGKRKVLRNAEVSFRLLFFEAIEGNFEAASVIRQFAEEYLKPEAERPSQAVFVVVPDGSSSLPRRSGRQRKKDLLPVSAASLFRKVAQQHGKLNGVRMTMWEAYLRQVNEMANENKRATRLLQQLRKAFPGEAPSGKTQIYLITEADAEL